KDGGAAGGGAARQAGLSSAGRDCRRCRRAYGVPREEAASAREERALRRCGRRAGHARLLRAAGDRRRAPRLRGAGRRDRRAAREARTRRARATDAGDAMTPRAKSGDGGEGMSKFLRPRPATAKKEHPSRLADPAPFPEDVREERRLRPPTLAEFVGQPQVREQLGIFLAAARQRGEAMDHLLFHGPPGLGKTTLASIVAHELGVEIKNTSGPVIERAGDLAGLITDLGPRGILFIDEIHRLSPVVEEYLYSALEDFKLDILLDRG